MDPLLTGWGPSMLMVVVVEFSEMRKRSVSGWWSMAVCEASGEVISDVCNIKLWTFFEKVARWFLDHWIIDTNKSYIWCKTISKEMPIIGGFIVAIESNQVTPGDRPPAQQPTWEGEGFRDNETWLLGPMDLDPADWRWQEIEEGPIGADRSGGCDLWC